jgi:hypothetical protein
MRNVLFYRKLLLLLCVTPLGVKIINLYYLTPKGVTNKNEQQVKWRDMSNLFWPSCGSEPSALNHQIAGTP